MVGTAVSARPVRWCVSGCSETEQSDALRCRNAEQTCRASQKYSRNGHRHSLWCREPGNLFRCLLRRRWFRLLKTGRFDLSTIISWQSSTIKRVARSTLAAEGYAVSEGLESAQWFRHLLTESHMSQSSLNDVEKESLKRPAIVFTDSDSLANSQERRWAKPRQEVQNRCVHASRRIQRS